jgi:hypothetical protein
VSSKIALFGREMTLRTHARLFYFIILTPWWEGQRSIPERSKILRKTPKPEKRFESA